MTEPWPAIAEELGKVERAHTALFLAKAKYPKHEQALTANYHTAIAALNKRVHEIVTKMADKAHHWSGECMGVGYEDDAREMLNRENLDEDPDDAEP